MECITWCGVALPSTTHAVQCSLSGRTWLVSWLAPVPMDPSREVPLPARGTRVRRWGVDSSGKAKSQSAMQKATKGNHPYAATLITTAPAADGVVPANGNRRRAMEAARCVLLLLLVRPKSNVAGVFLSWMFEILQLFPLSTARTCCRPSMHRPDSLAHSFPLPSCNFAASRERQEDYSRVGHATCLLSKSPALSQSSCPPCLIS